MGVGWIAEGEKYDGDFLWKDLVCLSLLQASTISSMEQQHVLLGMARGDGLCSFPVKGLGFTLPFCAGDGVSHHPGSTLCSTTSQNMALSPVYVAENNQIKWHWSLFAVAQILHSS